MAAPSLSPYKTNGPVKTGRTSNNGDYFSATLTAKAVYLDATHSELCAGYGYFSGVKAFTILPIYTWSEYPSGILDIPLSSGNPTASAPTEVYDSYNDSWRAGWNYPVPPTTEPTLHPIELRYCCILYSSATRIIVYLGEGGGYTLESYGAGMGHYYLPAANMDISASMIMNLDVGCRERVEIEQAVGAGSKWVWPDECFEDGMGRTAAVFDAVADTETCMITIGEDSVTLPTDWIPSYSFGSSRTITGRAGLQTAAIGSFGWGVTAEWHKPYTMTNNDVFGAITEVSKLTIGVKEMDLHFRDGQAYQGTDTNCQGDAEDNWFSYSARYSPNADANVYTQAQWTDLGLSYVHSVDFAMMDGEAQDDATNTTPSFTDSGGNSWSGTTSPLFVYDGVWSLIMNELDGSIMDTRNTETDASGNGASWARSNPAPSSLSLKFTNPQDFNDLHSGDINDFRCQFVYPREEEVVSWTLSNAVIDALTDTGTLGVGGWNSVNCDIAESGGNLVVSNASSGAYIYRSDFIIDADLWQPKHWPGHRFAQITADCVDGGSIAQDIDLTISVLRTGGADTSTKVYSHPLATTTEAIFDTCRPDGSGGVDTAESYIDTALPLDTIIEDSVRKSAEISSLSWSWGVGCFDRIEISGFIAGNTYALQGLTTIYVDPDPGLFGQVTYVQQECDNWLDVGATAITEYPEDSFDNEVCRHIIGVTNGRYAWEAPCVKVSKSPHYEVDLYVNYSLEQVFEDSNNRWPVDDFSAYAFTLTDAFDSGDWDSELSEYTNERVLFNKDVCPVWFCQSKRQDGEHDNLHDASIKIAPLYDRITVYPSWGDGTGVTARTGYVTLKSVKRVRGRANGLLYSGYSYGVDTLTAESAYVETLTSDLLGYYRSGDHNKTLALNYDSNIANMSPKNRVWMRICLSIPTGATWLNAVSSRQTGRAYVVYSLGAAINIRIFDYGNKSYQDRYVSANALDNSCGICYTAGRKAGLTVVYDLAREVYRIESFDEGKNWSAAVSIATGSCPQVCYSERARLEITSYFDTDSTYCKIKKGDGDYGSAILIATSDEAPAGLAVLQGTREHKILAEIVQSGAIVRYASVDDGKTWAVDE